MGRLAKVMQGQSQDGLKAYKKGGAVKHDDIAEDRKMMKAEMKKSGCSKCDMKCGGKVKK